MANKKIKVDLDLEANKIVNLQDPTLDQDAATKKYVDDNAGGLAKFEIQPGNSFSSGTPSSVLTFAMTQIYSIDIYSSTGVKFVHGTDYTIEDPGFGNQRNITFSANVTNATVYLIGT